jgi:hypothetical protein
MTFDHDTLVAPAGERLFKCDGLMIWSEMSALVTAFEKCKKCRSIRLWSGSPGMSEIFGAYYRRAQAVAASFLSCFLFCLIPKKVGQVGQPGPH